MSTIPLGFWNDSSTTFLPTADFPSYGWSFWKRNPNYTGFCLQVRRLSDSTLQNIGFNSDNFLDIGAMKNFVGNSTGVLYTFYDQFGGINLTEFEGPNDSRLMPRLIVSGVTKTFVNGTPCIEFGTGTFGRTRLLGGSGTNMAAQYNSTLYWSEENSATAANAVAANNNANTVIFRGDSSGSASTTVFWDYFSVSENYYINEALGIEGYQNNTTANSKDLYNTRSYKVSTQGARLFASRGGGYNSLGTGFILGGNEGTYFRGLLNELLIYNNITQTQSKVYEIQGVLNRAHQLYNIASTTNDLVLWYDAGNTSSYPGTGTTITDLSVGGSTGTLNNGVTYSSADGGKFVLDGTNDWISTSGTTVYPWNVTGGDFSVEVWVKFSNANQSARIFSNRNSTSGSMMSLIGGTIAISGNITSSKKISFAITNYNATRAFWQNTTNDQIDGNWKHIVATRNGRTLTIYVNSVSQGLTTVNNTGSGSPIYIDTATTWRVADAGGGTGGNGAFDISIMRLYKRALTQEQVTRNYNLEKSRYGL